MTAADLPEVTAEAGEVRVVLGEGVTVGLSPARARWLSAQLLEAAERAVLPAGRAVERIETAPSGRDVARKMIG